MNTNEQTQIEHAALQQRIDQLQRELANCHQHIAALRESEEHYRLLTEFSPNIILVLVNYTIVYINPAGIFTLGGTTADQFIGSSIMERIPIAYHDIARQHMEEVLQEQKSRAFVEGFFTCLDGREIAIEVSGRAFTYQGQPAMLVIASDCTERKYMEEQLRASHARLQAIFNNAAIGIVSSDRYGNYSFINPQAANVIGYTPEEFYKLTPGVLLYPDDRPQALAQFHDMLNGKSDGYHCERRYLSKDGSIVWVDTSVKAIYDDDGNLDTIIGVMSDCTERKRMEEQWHQLNAELEQRVAERTAEIHATSEAFRTSEQRFRAIFERASVGIILGDTTGHVVESNPAFQRFLGYTAEELCGMYYEDFTHPDDVQVEYPLAVQIMSGQIDSYNLEKRYRRKDGRIVWGYVFTSLIYDAEGQMQFGISLVTDMTERRQMEALMIEKERFTTMRYLTGIVAHEVNTPLQIVLGSLEWMPHADAHQQVTFLEMAKEEIQRVGLILRQLMETYQPSIEEPTKVDMVALIERVLFLMSGQLAKLQIHVECHRDPDVPFVYGRGGELTQVIMNLIVNAMEAMPNGGTLRIHAQPHTPHCSDVACKASSSAHLMLEVSDTGGGISVDVAQQIFDPFFTTKQAGNGLGLFVCKRIVEQHGGIITVQKHPETGCTFTVILPTRS